MQGNAFLGAFFAVSPFLEEFGIDRDHFNEQVEKQYRKKFGRFGDAVVASNMEVMLQGFSRVQEIVYGAVDAPDRSSMRGESLFPLAGCGATCRGRPEAGRRRPSGRPSSGGRPSTASSGRASATTSRPRSSRPRASAAAATGDDGDEVRRAAA